MSNVDMTKKVAVVVGLYDTFVGAWPLFSLATFQSITGLSHYLETVRVLGMAWTGLGVMLLVFHKMPRLTALLGIASTIAGTCLAVTEIALIVTNKLPAVFYVQVVAELAIGATWIKTLFFSASQDKDMVEVRNHGDLVAR